MTTATCNDLADYQWLTGDEAGRLLAELAADSAPLHTAVARLRRNLSATRTHLLIDQVELRRRAADKFTHADRMFFTRTALEQATDEWTAAYKAATFHPAASRAEPVERPDAIFADLCCGIGGDLCTWNSKRRRRRGHESHRRPSRRRKRPRRAESRHRNPHRGRRRIRSRRHRRLAHRPRPPPDRPSHDTRSITARRTAPPSIACSRTHQTPPSNSPPPQTYRRNGPAAANANGSAAIANAANKSPGTAT